MHHIQSFGFASIRLGYRAKFLVGTASLVRGRGAHWLGSMRGRGREEVHTHTHAHTHTHTHSAITAYSTIAPNSTYS
jgi:hypothetical protein